ncbi:hypothetical protein RBB68_14495 [Leptospira interrogans]|nr:hypothetical protein [Leptospira interrogans]MCW3822372.1 hypothetical protein [Leptospira interrogans]MDC2812342.1 hypothetical protein [Leptospira interrogans]WML93583.1 hypothetical protein RBB68_14495 [Leptospira interrogans]
MGVAPSFAPGGGFRTGDETGLSLFRAKWGSVMIVKMNKLG